MVKIEETAFCVPRKSIEVKIIGLEGDPTRVCAEYPCPLHIARQDLGQVQQVDINRKGDTIAIAGCSAVKLDNETTQSTP